MAIEIPFLANVVRFLKGTNDMEEALDDVADTLDDVAKDAKKAGDKTGDALTDAAKDAKRAGDKIGDEISDGAKDAEQSVERLERTFKDMADTARRENDQASDSMKREFDEGTDAAKRDLAELKDEAVQNASETFSSFDGSITSLADGIQGTLGGVISNIGPAGAVAGAAAAIGVGLLTAEFERSEEKAAELREQASELARQIIEAGGDIRDVPMSDVLQDWAFELSNLSPAWDLFGDKTQTNFEAISDAAEVAGLSARDMLNALSGRDSAQTIAVLDKMEDRLAEVRRGITNMAASRTGGTERAAELRKEQDALEDGIKLLEERSGVTREGIDGAREYAAAAADIAAQDEAAARASEARTDAANALQGALDESITTFAEYGSAEKGTFDPGAYIAAMAARREATTNFNSNVQEISKQFGLTAEETQAILDLGLDFAPYLQSIMDSGFTEGFVGEVQAAVGGGQEIIDGTPLNATVTVESNSDAAKGDLDATAADRDTTIKGNAETRTAARDLDAVADKKRTATITAKANTTLAVSSLRSLERRRTVPITAVASVWAADQALDRLTRPRTVPITAEVRNREGRRIP